MELETYKGMSQSEINNNRRSQIVVINIEENVQKPDTSLLTLCGVFSFFFKCLSHLSPLFQ